MLSLPSSTRVFVCRAATDMRCSFDKLSALVQQTLEQDPLSGHLFVFMNRRVPRLRLPDFPPSQYDVIDTKVTERLCQRSSYFVKRFLRPVVKIKATGELFGAAAPTSVFERSYADVTLLSGMLVDKFQYQARVL